MAKRLVTYRFFNWGLIIFYVPWAAIVYLFNGTLNVIDALYGTFLLGFALLEQINYHYYQLMYDNRADLAYLLQHKRLKKGFIAREMERQ